mmetsp:Transcript_14758/g.36131  ORF Transcript_14758/g.36131 Transcript_14758/m.36131 type:complete len:218 (-) Transcript_14758:860-1513(-)
MVPACSTTRGSSASARCSLIRSSMVPALLPWVRTKLQCDTISTRSRFSAQAFTSSTVRKFEYTLRGQVFACTLYTSLNLSSVNFALFVPPRTCTLFPVLPLKWWMAQYAAPSIPALLRHSTHGGVAPTGISAVARPRKAWISSVCAGTSTRYTREGGQAASPASTGRAPLSSLHSPLSAMTLLATHATAGSKRKERVSRSSTSAWSAHRPSLAPLKL